MNIRHETQINGHVYWAKKIAQLGSLPFLVGFWVGPNQWWVHFLRFGQSDVFDPSCLFSALDLAVLTNCSSCAQILLRAGANASQITLDQDSSMENLPVPL